MKYFLILFMVCCSYYAQAARSDGEQLVKGCNELIGMYKNKNEKRLFASQLASPSDAMLAGYCMGVIKSFKQMANPRVTYEPVRCAYRVRGPCHKVTEMTLCENDDWFEIAEKVANYWDAKKTNYSVNDLLMGACSG